MPINHAWCEMYKRIPVLQLEKISTTNAKKSCVHIIPCTDAIKMKCSKNKDYKYVSCAYDTSKRTVIRRFKYQTLLTAPCLYYNNNWLTKQAMLEHICLNSQENLFRPAKFVCSLIHFAGIVFTNTCLSEVDHHNQIIVCLIKTLVFGGEKNISIAVCVTSSQQVVTF